jgi:hypothetical protein
VTPGTSALPARMWRTSANSAAPGRSRSTSSGVAQPGMQPAAGASRASMAACTSCGDAAASQLKDALPPPRMAGTPGTSAATAPGMKHGPRSVGPDTPANAAAAPSAGAQHQRARAPCCSRSTHQAMMPAPLCRALAPYASAATQPPGRQWAQQEPHQRSWPCHRGGCRSSGRDSGVTAGATAGVTVGVAEAGVRHGGRSSGRSSGRNSGRGSAAATAERTSATRAAHDRTLGGAPPPASRLAASAAAAYWHVVRWQLPCTETYAAGGEPPHPALSTALPK